MCSYLESQGHEMSEKISTNRCLGRRNSSCSSVIVNVSSWAQAVVQFIDESLHYLDTFSSNPHSGCVVPFEKVTSRTFTCLQSSCHHSCDMHKVLYEATERFRTRHCNLLCRRVNQKKILKLTNTTSDKISPTETQRSCRHWKGKDDSSTEFMKKIV